MCKTKPIWPWRGGASLPEGEMCKTNPIPGRAAGGGAHAYKQSQLAHADGKEHGPAMPEVEPAPRPIVRNKANSRRGGGKRKCFLRKE